MWIAGSLTAVVLSPLVALIWLLSFDHQCTFQLTTLRGALCKKLTQLILCDFEQHSPRLSISKYKALLVQGMLLIHCSSFCRTSSLICKSDKDQCKEIVCEGIHGINEYLHNDNNQPATATETHSARAFKFWYNWICDGCKPGANLQDLCMFQLLEKKVHSTEQQRRMKRTNGLFPIVQ